MRSAGARREQDTSSTRTRKTQETVRQEASEARGHIGYEVHKT